MKRIVLFTKYGSVNLLKNYYLDEVVALDDGIEIALENNIKLFLAISDFKDVSLDNLLKYISKDKIMKYTKKDNESALDKVLNYLITLQCDEIIILDSFAYSLEHTQELLYVLKKYRIKITILSEKEAVSYYSVGSHVISKQGYSSFMLIGYPNCEISMEHVSQNISNIKLDFTNNLPLGNKIFERVAVLKVISGGVLLVLKNDD